MTTATTISTTSEARVRSRAKAVWGAAAAAGAVAAIATTAIAAVARAAGADLALDGERIPLLGFAQMTLLGAPIGAVLAMVLRRRAFVATTATLTALSLVPDVTMGFDAADAIVLIATHLVAAAIIVPALARRTRPATSA